jgi:hypothetical protein
VLHGVAATGAYAHAWPLLRPLLRLRLAEVSGASCACGAGLFIFGMQNNHA